MSDLNLFPSAYPDTCPGEVSIVAAPTADPIAEVRQLVYLSRLQAIAGIRLGGQNLAELQNQSIPTNWRVLHRVADPDPVQPVIIVVNPDPPVQQPAPLPAAPTSPPASPIQPAPVPAQAVIAYESVGFAYWAGGNNNGTHQQIDKLWYGAATVAPLNANIGGNRFRQTGLTSNTSGYWLGGQSTNDISSKLRTTRAIRFRDERTRSVSAQLTTDRCRALGIWRPDRGYVMGNFRPNEATIDKMDFATEAVTLFGASLPASVGGLSGSHHPGALGHKAYFACGANNDLRVQRFTFDTEAIALTAASLSTPRDIAASGSSETSTFWLGGRNNVSNATYRSIEALSHATETMRAIGARLSEDNYEMGASNGWGRVYVGGGSPRSCHQKMERYFFDQHTEVTHQSLSRAGTAPVPTGKP